MKKTLYILGSILLLAAGIFSCTKLLTKEQLTTQALKAVQTLSGTDSATTYLSVILSGEQVLNTTDSSQRVSVAASFIDSVTGNAANITGLSINGRSLTRKADSSYNFSYSDTTAAILSEGKALQGTSVRIKVTGATAADTVSQQVYFPKRVINTFTSAPVYYFNLLHDQTVNWTPDPTNPVGQVMIKIWYSPGASTFLTGSTTLPTTEKILTYTVSDNGSYTIPTADLQAAFKNNEYVWLMVGRGNYASGTLPISHRNVYFFTAASGTTNAMNCQCAANWQNTTTALRCKSGSTTGEQEQEQRDVSPCSSTYNQTQWVAAGTNLTACPACTATNCTGNNHKCIGGVCQTGTLTALSRVTSNGKCTTTWGYVFSDGTSKIDHTSVTNGPCPQE